MKRARQSMYGPPIVRFIVQLFGVRTYFDELFFNAYVLTVSGRCKTY